MKGIPIKQISKKLEPYLCQGDIIIGYESRQLLDFEDKLQGFIILNNTCDVKNYDDLSSILLAPLINVDDIIQKLLESIIIGIHKNLAQKNKLTRESIIRSLRKGILGKIKELAKYRGHSFFLIFPNRIFSNEFIIADLTNIINIDICEIDKITKLRKATLLNPWREKLGFMTGSIFNRIAVDDLDDKDEEVISNYINEKYEEELSQKVETIFPDNKQTK